MQPVISENCLPSVNTKTRNLTAKAKNEMHFDEHKINKPASKSIRKITPSNVSYDFKTSTKVSNRNKTSRLESLYSSPYAKCSQSDRSKSRNRRKEISNTYAKVKEFTEHKDISKEFKTIANKYEIGFSFDKYRDVKKRRGLSAVPPMTGMVSIYETSTEMMGKMKVVIDIKPVSRVRVSYHEPKLLQSTRSNSNHIQFQEIKNTNKTKEKKKSETRKFLIRKSHKVAPSEPTSDLNIPPPKEIHSNKFHEEKCDLIDSNSPEVFKTDSISQSIANSLETRSPERIEDVQTSKKNKLSSNFTMRKYSSEDILTRKELNNNIKNKCFDSNHPLSQSLTNVSRAGEWKDNKVLNSPVLQKQSTEKSDFERTQTPPSNLKFDHEHLESSHPSPAKGSLSNNFHLDNRNSSLLSLRPLSNSKPYKSLSEIFKSTSRDNQSTLTTGVLSLGGIFWPPVGGSIKYGGANINSRTQAMSTLSDTGLNRLQERRPALCNPTEMIVSQEFRESAEKSLNAKRSRFGKKLSHFVKSVLFTSYDVDLT